MEIKFLEGVEHIRKKPNMYVKNNTNTSQAKSDLIIGSLCLAIDHVVNKLANKINIKIIENKHVLIDVIGEGLEVKIDNKKYFEYNDNITASLLLIAVCKNNKNIKFLEQLCEDFMMPTVVAFTKKFVLRNYWNGIKYEVKTGKGRLIKPLEKIAFTNKTGFSMSYEIDDEILSNKFVDIKYLKSVLCKISNLIGKNCFFLETKEG